MSDSITLERYASTVMAMSALYIFAQRRVYEIAEPLPCGNKHAMKIVASGVDMVAHLVTLRFFELLSVTGIK